MKKNMGSIDKVLRILVAIAFVILYFTNVVTGVWGIVMLVIAAIFVITSIIGICPAYLPFGISTCKKQD
jgi:hypothetical protein